MCILPDEGCLSHSQHFRCQVSAPVTENLVIASLFFAYMLLAEHCIYFVKSSIYDDLLSELKFLVFNSCVFSNIANKNKTKSLKLKQANNQEKFMGAKGAGRGGGSKSTSQDDEIG